MFAAIGKHGANPRLALPMRLLHGRAFGTRRAKRLLILYEAQRIAYTPIYPFLMYKRQFEARFDVDIRLLPVVEALDGVPARFHGATHVIAQTWLTDPPEKLENLRASLADLPGPVRLIYLDSFANADVRFARHLGEFELYFKKSILQDPRDMLRTTQGHTTLTEYYGQLYGIPQEPTNWQVPESFLPKLRLAPNFLTGPGLAEVFLGAPPPAQGPARDIDLHARLGGTGEDSWYGAMRRDSEARVDALCDISTATGTGISREAFMDELRRSKVCFSPFGYGELCWRDVEAMMTGAVLIKPDMSHLRTEPDLYRDDETYVSIAWDFSDFEARLKDLLSDEAKRQRIAQRAWQVARDYLAGEGPVETYTDIFA